MKPQDEYVPLFPLLADYWDKPLSELPEALQTRLISEDFAIATTGFDWDDMSPNGRRVRVTQMDKENDPRFMQECQNYSDLLDEIEKWERMEHQNDPVKAKIQDEKLAALHAELENMKQQSAAVAPAANGGAVMRGITKQQVINAFEEVHLDRNGWNNALSDVPKWIEQCLSC